MKSIRFYLVVLPLVLTCCNPPPGAKKADNGGSQGLVDTVDIVRQELALADSDELIEVMPPNDTVPQKPSLEGMTPIGDPSFRRDTTVNDYHISYVAQDNEEEVIYYSEDHYFVGREIIMDIKYLNDSVLHKKLTRDFFSSYIPKEEIEKYSIHYFSLDSVGHNGNVYFYLNVCQPDTDICYSFQLSVSRTGDIEIRKLEEYYESDEM